MDYKQTKAKLSMINNGEYVKIPLRITETHKVVLPPPNPSAQPLTAVWLAGGRWDSALGHRKQRPELPFVLLSYTLKLYIFVFYNYSTHNIIQ